MEDMHDMQTCTHTRTLSFHVHLPLSSHHNSMQHSLRQLQMLSLLNSGVPFSVLFNQVISLCEKPRDSPLKYIIVDTPGQIEIFTWSASGAIITEAFASGFPTMVAFIIDTPRCAHPQTFMSNMLQVSFSTFQLLKCWHCRTGPVKSACRHFQRSSACLRCNACISGFASLVLAGQCGS